MYAGSNHIPLPSFGICCQTHRRTFGIICCKSPKIFLYFFAERGLFTDRYVDQLGLLPQVQPSILCHFSPKTDHLLEGVC